MKYVMFKVNGRAVPVIFPNALVHESVARGMRHALLEMAGRNWEISIMSAGEIYVSGVACNGQSETLGIASRGEDDARIINSYDYTHGIL